MEKKIKVFWREGCAKCPEAKERVAKVLVDLQMSPKCLELHNIETVDGMAEAAFYGALSTPSVVILDEHGAIMQSDLTGLKSVLTTLKSVWLGEVPSELILKHFLNQ